MGYDGPRTYKAVRSEGSDWNPGEGWYVVAANEDDIYVAYCGPVEDPGSQLDAERIARALTAAEL